MNLSFIGIFVVGIFIGFLIASLYWVIRKQKEHRKALATSRAVITGQVSEQLAPLLPNFPYHYKDAMFLGKGVDYVIFDGLHKGNLKQIVFLEIKTGASRLSSNEQQIKVCLEQKRVRYEVRKKDILMHEKKE